MKNTRILVFISLFISIEVILTRFLAFETPIIRVGFGFLPIALSSIMFGPILGGITAVISDVIGMMIAPKGMYFPGFTISAFLTGAIYGLFLYKRKRNLWRILLTVLTISIFVDSILNTIWLIMMGLGNWGIIMPRIFKNIIMVPIQITVIYFGWYYLSDYIENFKKGSLKNSGA